MKLISIHDKQTIHRFYMREPYLHLYELGDLDDFFWPYTTWYGLQDDGRIEQIALLYTDLSIPVVQAMSAQRDSLTELIRRMLPMLPGYFYAHFTEGSDEAFEGTHSLQSEGQFYKMGLTDSEKLEGLDIEEAVQLTEADRPALELLYRKAYPGNWFAARMLQTGQYFGIKRGGEIVSVAGVHVYSAEYGVAALGNVATLPELRGQGLAKVVSAALCKSLLETTEFIGLNVNKQNGSALQAYGALGFSVVGEYGEYTVSKH